VDLTRRNRLLNAAILVAPVTLSGVNGREGYLLDGCDKDVMVNFALMEKMRGDFGLTLPEIPEIERLKPSNHFEQVEAETGRQHLWQVESGSIGLGFFTFSKFIL
jgi:hypothetical protein